MLHFHTVTCMIPGLWHAKFDDVQQRFSSTVVVAAVPFCADNIVVFYN